MTHQPLPGNVDIRNELQILFFEAGTTLVRLGERSAGLYYVIDGTLEVLVKADADQNSFGRTFAEFSGQNIDAMKREQQRAVMDSEFQQRRMFMVQAGGLAGYLSALTGHPSFVYPNVLLTFARRLMTKLPPLVWYTDLTLEWFNISAGKMLYRQDDPKSDAIYIVLNGRLRSTQERHDESRGSDSSLIAEYGQGESVGELEVLTGIPRTCHVHAIRDTELAKMPKTLFSMSCNSVYIVSRMS
jgi:lysophospholipid hydrolase